MGVAKIRTASIRDGPDTPSVNVKSSGHAGTPRRPRDPNAFAGDEQGDRPTKYGGILQSNELVHKREDGQATYLVTGTGITYTAVSDFVPA